MGHRVMETPNMRGKTIVRHLVPKAVRRSRKRALRMAAKSPQPAEPTPQRVPAATVDATPRRPQPVRRSWAQVLQRPVKPPEPAKVSEPTRPEPAQVPAVAAAPILPSQPRPSVKREVRRAAKPKKRAKPVKPSERPAQQEPETEVAEADPRLTDKFKDGVVEWGIKREGGTDSET